MDYTMDTLSSENESYTEGKLQPSERNLKAEVCQTSEEENVKQSMFSGDVDLTDVKKSSENGDLHHQNLTEKINNSHEENGRTVVSDLQESNSPGESDPDSDSSEEYKEAMLSPEVKVKQEGDRSLDVDTHHLSQKRRTKKSYRRNDVRYWENYDQIKTEDMQGADTSRNDGHSFEGHCSPQPSLKKTPFLSARSKLRARKKRKMFGNGYSDHDSAGDTALSEESSLNCKDNDELASPLVVKSEIISPSNGISRHDVEEEETTDGDELDSKNNRCEFYNGTGSPERTNLRPIGKLKITGRGGKLKVCKVSAVEDKNEINDHDGEIDSDDTVENLNCSGLRPKRKKLSDENEGVENNEDTSPRSSESPLSSSTGSKRKLKCKYCSKIFTSSDDLSQHIETHVTRKFSCSVCNTCFQTKTLLKKHVMTHLDSIPFVCPECSAVCRSEEDLRMHKLTHAAVRSFPCTECPYAAKRQKDLTKHMLVHTAEKIHTCQFCKFSSKRKYSLQRHMKTAHSMSRMYDCVICTFRTSSVDSFKVHIALHASSRSMACIICGAVIKKPANLLEHLMSHSNDLDNSCKICEEAFATNYEYMLHLLVHRDITEDDPDLCMSLLLNGAAGFPLGQVLSPRKNKMVMDTPTMEAKIVQMSSLSSRLADMTKVVTLLNEKNKVISQLGEISTLATELAVISGNVLQSYKNMYGIPSGSKNKSLSNSNDGEDETSFLEDDYGLASVLNLTAATIKQELQDTFPATETEMQIQVDFDGEPISCIQKEESYVTTRSKMGGKNMKCPRCNLLFTDGRSLKRHIMAHDDIRPYSCEKCGQSFRRNEHLKKHMVTHSDERPFTCKDCPYAAKTEHRLKIHMLCHSQTKAFSCQHCTYTARTNYELNHHMKRHEPRTCSQCSFVCYSRPEMKKHVFTHSTFDCTECEFTTNDRSEYTKHIKKHSLVQHLCCELCGYSCDTMKKFKYHKLRHENKTPYQCPDCDYKCSSRASFDCHRLKHAGLKPYLCSFCGAAFRKTSHLNQHLLIHKDEKAFKCQECGYACRTKHNLKEHEMTHSGEKPFACRYCSFSCRRNKALQLHMLKHENHGILLPQMPVPLMQMPPMQMPLPMSMMTPPLL